MKGPTQIMIIDDDSRNIFALRLMLKSKGYPVVSATGARSGLEILRQDPGLKVLLLDMMMPDMDGYEALEKIRQDGSLKNLKVVAVTAQAMAGDREKCLAAGADAYLSKPVNVDDLLSLLKAYLHEG